MARARAGGRCGGLASSPTGNAVETDYVYVMELEGDRIRHIPNIWNAAYALR